MMAAMYMQCIVVSIHCIINSLAASYLSCPALHLEFLWMYVQLEVNSSPSGGHAPLQGGEYPCVDGELCPLLHG